MEHSNHSNADQSIIQIEGKKDPGVPNFANFKQKKQNKEEANRKKVIDISIQTSGRSL